MTHKKLQEIHSYHQDQDQDQNQDLQKTVMLTVAKASQMLCTYDTGTHPIPGN